MQNNYQTPHLVLILHELYMSLKPEKQHERLDVPTYYAKSEIDATTLHLLHDSTSDIDSNMEAMAAKATWFNFEATSPTYLSDIL